MLLILTFLISIPQQLENPFFTLSKALSSFTVLSPTLSDQYLSHFITFALYSLSFSSYSTLLPFFFLGSATRFTNMSRHPSMISMDLTVCMGGLLLDGLLLGVLFNSS